MSSSNVFLGTKQKPEFDKGDVLLELPHGTLFTASYEDDTAIYIDNYLACGYTGTHPYVTILKNTDIGYEVLFQTHAPTWTYQPEDWSKEDCSGTEYSKELYKELLEKMFAQ